MQKYQVEKIVGQGSFGKAYLVRRKTDSKRCIIKQISIGKMGPKEVKQTELEATLLQRLQHPNIVKFLESFRENRSLMICMEYADGGDLEAYLKNRRGRLLSESEAMHMFVQIVLAMKHVHDRKILHRDLKTQNVFLVNQGNKPIVKLGDFGVSRVMERTVDLASTMVGTPYYMPPEICNNERYNSKCDIWSLGIILYELMALRYPFDGRSIKDLYRNILTRPSPPVSSAHYSKDLREIVCKMLEKKASKRPSVNTILSQPVVVGHIDGYLTAMQKQCEFSHTILHGKHILKGPPPSAPMPGASQVGQSGVGAVGGAVMAAANRLPNPPTHTPPRGRAKGLNAPSTPPPPPSAAAAAAAANQPRVVEHRNPKVVEYYARVAQRKAHDVAIRERLEKKRREERAALVARQQMADDARKQAQMRLQAQANMRARRESEALEMAAQARARLNAQKAAREREKAGKQAKEKAEAEEAAARRAKDRELERKAMIRRRAEREEFNKKQEAARKLVHAKEEARERDVAAAAKAIRQAKIDRHNAAVKERDERAAAKAAAAAREMIDAATKQDAVDTAVTALEHRAVVGSHVARQAHVVWPAAEVVVRPPAPPNSAHAVREKERQARLKEDEDALKERRRANLAKFENDVVNRNREKARRITEKEKAQKARAEALLQQKELALMVKGLPVNVSKVLKDNVAVGNLPKSALPKGFVRDPVNVGEGDPFRNDAFANANDISTSDEEEQEMHHIELEYAQGESDGPDSDFDRNADDSNDDEGDKSQNTPSKAFSDLHLDIESDDSDDAADPSRKAASPPLSPEASPSWLAGLEKKMGQIHSDVAVLKALSPRSGPSSNISTPASRPSGTPKTQDNTPRAHHGHDHGVGTPGSAARTPLAMRALGGHQQSNNARSNVRAYMGGQGTPKSQPSCVNGRGGIVKAQQPRVKETPEERAVAALERRAVAQKRQDDLKEYMKLQREARIRERVAANDEAEEEDDESTPSKASAPSSPRKANGALSSPNKQKEMHSSKSAPALVVQNRNPTGRNYSTQKGASGSRKGGVGGAVVVEVAAHEFNYLAEEGPSAKNVKPNYPLGSPNARKPSMSGRKPKGGDLVVIEDAPGSMARDVRSAEVISAAARSRPLLSKADSRNAEGVNPRSGHSDFRLDIDIDEGAKKSSLRVSLKPAVPSRVVAPRAPGSPKSSPVDCRTNSLRQSASSNSVNMSAAERRMKREKERAEMRQAMKERKDAHDAKSDIEFDLLLPPGESPYHNAGEDPDKNPVQHRLLEHVDNTPATYVNGPFEQPDLKLTRSTCNDDDSSIGSGVDEAPPTYSENDPTLDQEELDIEQEIANVMKLGHGDMVLDPDATEMDLGILLQQMQDVVGRFHARVDNINTAAIGNNEPERADKEAATLKGSKSLAKALATMRHLEGTLLGGLQLPSASTTITYDDNEESSPVEVASPISPSHEDDEDSEDDDDVFGEEEEEMERMHFSQIDSDDDDGADDADLSAHEESSRDLGDYRPTDDDGTFDSAIPLDDLLGAGSYDDEDTFLHVRDTSEVDQLGPTAMHDQHSDAAQAIAEKLRQLEEHVNLQKGAVNTAADAQINDADYQEKLFSSDLEDDDSIVDDNDSVDEVSAIDPLTITGKFALNTEGTLGTFELGADGVEETPTKTPYKSRTSFGSAQKDRGNAGNSANPPSSDGDDAGKIGDNIDTMYNKFGGEKVLKALGVLRKSLESENYVTDGAELTPEQEEAAREHEDKLLSQLEKVLGEDGLMYLDNLMALCQAMG